MYLQIRNTTISRINIYNPYIHIIHILACFFTSIYPNRFTSNVVHLYRFSKLFSQFSTFRLPGWSCMKVPTICSQRGGCDWQHFHPLTLDCTPWPWIAPLDLGLHPLTLDLTGWNVNCHGIFDHQRAYWFQEACYVWFMFLLTNHRPSNSKEAGFVSKSTCLCKNSCEA